MRLFISGLDGSDLFVDGFSNATADTLPSGWSYEGTIVHTPGGKSLKLIVPASTNSAVDILSGIIASGTAGYRRVYLYCASLPGSTRTIIGSAGTGLIRLTSAGYLQYVNSGGTQTSTDTTALSTGQWYCVEWLVSSSTANITRLRVNGIDQGTSTTAIITNWIDRLGVANEAGGTPTIYFDDYAIDDAYWVGESESLLALPISDNARNGWTGGVGGTTNLWDAVDNTPPVGTATETDTTQIESATNSATDNCDLNLKTYTNLGVGTLAGYTGPAPAAGAIDSLVGNTSSDTASATSFTAPSSGDVSMILVTIKKVGTPTDNMRFELWTHSSTIPGTKICDLVTVSSNDLSTTGRLFALRCASGGTITNGTKYWVAAFRTGSIDAANYYLWTRDSTQRSGQAIAHYDGATWSAISAGNSISLAVYSGAGDYISVVRAVCAHGEDIATGTKNGALLIVSNPAQAAEDTFIYGNDVGALGTYPTNWTLEYGALQQNPSITVGSSAVLRIGKRTATTRVVSCCFMGMYVEWGNFPVNFNGEDEYYSFPQQIPIDEVTTVFA